MKLKLITFNPTRLLDRALRAWATAFNTLGVELEDEEVKLSNLEVDVAGRLIPSGGTTGQVLAKNSNTDYDSEWVNAGTSGSNGSDTVIDLGDRMTGNEVIDLGVRI